MSKRRHCELTSVDPQVACSPHRDHDFVAFTLLLPASSQDDSARNVLEHALRWLVRKRVVFINTIRGDNRARFVSEPRVARLEELSKHDGVRLGGHALAKMRELYADPSIMSWSSRTVMWPRSSEMLISMFVR
jgi:hypothetical protein